MTDPPSPVSRQPDALPLSDIAGMDATMAWAMVDASPDALVMVDEAGVIELVNRQTEALFGYDRGELLGRPVEELLPDRLRQVHGAHRTRYRATPEVRAMGSGLDLLARHRDGTEFPVEISLSPLTGDGSLRVIAAVRDISDRVATQATAERTRRAIDSIRDGVYLFEPDELRFVYVNQGAANQSGYLVDELVGGMTPLHLAPEFTASGFRSLLTPLLDGTDPVLSFETILRHRSGRDSPVDVVMDYPTVDAQDHRVVVAVVRDVSERVEAEQHARLVQYGIDSVSDAVFMCDETTMTFSYVNQGAVDMHGYSREELLDGMTPADLAPGLPADQLQAALAHLASRPEESFRLVTEARTKQGATLPVEVHMNWPEPGQPGGRRPVMAVVRDISEQVAAEARIRATFDDGPIAMAVISLTSHPDGEIVEVNQAMLDLFDFDRAEMIGMPAARLQLSDDGRPDDPALASGEYEPAGRIEPVRAERADGTRFWIQLHLSPLGSGGDTLIAHAIDLTAEVEAEAARRQGDDFSRALSQVRLAMLEGASRSRGLELICESARETMNAVSALIITPSGTHERLRIEASSGVPGDVLNRLEFHSSAGAVGEVFQTGAPRHTSGQRHRTAPGANLEIMKEQGVGPTIMAALPSGLDSVGVLVVARLADDPPFTDADLDPIQQFAAGAATAIEIAAARETQNALEILEDRERIGRDMHDNVIGRLFATGMSLQSTLARLDDRATQERVSGAVGEIDDAIKEIRTAVYGIRAQPDWGRGIRGDILALAADQREHLGFEPTVNLAGRINDLEPTIADELLATLREAFSNIIKYAAATTVTINIEVDDTVAMLTVIDNGVGFEPGGRPEAGSKAMTGNGLRNMTARAANLGGETTITSTVGEGTTIGWTVPLSPR